MIVHKKRSEKQGRDVWDFDARIDGGASTDAAPRRPPVRKVLVSEKRFIQEEICVKEHLH